MGKSPNQKKSTPIALTNYAYEASVVPTSFILEGVMSQDHAVKVMLQLTTALGSDSNYKAEEIKINSPNPQKVDVALLPPDCETLRISGGLRITAGSSRPFTCNVPDFDRKMQDFIRRYADRGGFEVHAARLVWCMAQGGWVWKNRETTINRHVAIAILGDKAGDWRFDVEKFVARNEETFPGVQFLQDATLPGSRPVADLIKKIALALSEKRSFLFVKLTFEGLGLPFMPLYPSQEFVVGEARGKADEVSRVLAGIPVDSGQINQASAIALSKAERIACLHPQKVGNALRRYDEWYSEDLEYGVLPVEVYGYVKRVSTHVRGKGSGDCFYDMLVPMTTGKSALFDHVMDGTEPFATSGALSDLDAKAHYFVGVLMRGGVFGIKQSDKTEGKAEAEAAQ